MRLDIDDQVPTQLNKRCLFAIKFSRSVDLQRRKFIYSTQLLLRPDLVQDPSIQDNPLCKQCNSTSCYAAPIMQSTCYAKHLLMHSTSSKPPANEPLPSRNAHQNALTQTRNLSKFRPNFSLNFRHKPT